MRTSLINRKTAETEISLSINLDGKGISNVSSGVGFLDHMLTLFASHGRFDLDLVCKGDVQVDGHHTVEDIGICLGRGFKEALGEKKGINRYGSMLLPMDEALVLCALDISGRSFLVFDVEMYRDKVGDFDTELVQEFMVAFSRELGLTLHLKKMDGENTHHIIEATFKSIARALKEAVKIDESLEGAVPSTKGVL